MYARVPSVMPVRVVDRASSADNMAMPKSPSFGTPSAVSRMFAGLISRWTTPAAWAVSSASSTAATHSHASRGGMGPYDSRRSARLPPSTSSITMNARPSSMPTSCTVTMLRWARRAMVRASASNRARMRARASSAGSRSLIARFTSSRASHASCTVAIPPAPSRRRRRYRPDSRSAASSAIPASLAGAAAARAPAARDSHDPPSATAWHSTDGSLVTDSGA